MDRIIRRLELLTWMVGVNIALTAGMLLFACQPP